MSLFLAPGWFPADEGLWFFLTALELVLFASRIQVLASRYKIYIILEFVTGGELFDKIVRFSVHLFGGFVMSFGLLVVEF